MIWGLSLHGWEEAMRFSLAVVGVAGLIVGVSTYFVVTLQREEIASSRDEFDRYRVEAGREVASVRAEADSKIESAREDAKVAVEKAQADIANAKKQAAALEKETAQARLEQDRLRAQLAWRHLTADQSRIIARNIRNVGFEFKLFAVGSDPESMVFGGEIKKALEAGGRNIDLFGAQFLGPVPILGIVVSGTLEQINQLAKVFTEAGLNVVGEVGGSDNPHIKVGSKPPPP